MSRMGELSRVLDDMISCGEGMIKAANEIKEIFSESAESTDTAGTMPDELESEAKPALKAGAEHTPAAAPETEAAEKTRPQPGQDKHPVKQKVPESEKRPQPETYSFEQVRKACAAKSHAGHTAEVRALIEKYGADRLSGIKQEAYPALMHDLEVIG